MDPKDYDHWYRTPRGQWIGGRETRLVVDALDARHGESMLDVGCGTGYFTRSLAGLVDGLTAGVDISQEWIRYARQHDSGGAEYLVADAMKLPFGDASFDLVVSIAAVSFMGDETAALGEILRVCRRRVAIGLLNRHSLLYRKKGMDGGSGAYRGARWHTVHELRQLFHDLPVKNVTIQTAIQFPSGGAMARMMEGLWPPGLDTGGFILVIADVDRCSGS